MNSLAELHASKLARAINRASYPDPLDPRRSVIPIGHVLNQIAFEFGSSPSLMEDLRSDNDNLDGNIFGSQATSIIELKATDGSRSSIEKIIEQIPIDNQTSEGEFAKGNFYELPLSSPEDFKDRSGNYVRLCIELLLTCAEDLVDADKKINNPEIQGRQRRQAEEMLAETRAWLNNEVPMFDESSALKNGTGNNTDSQVGCLISFDCTIKVLESALRYQSHNNVTIPDIISRQDEFASWILGNPKEARYVLSHYLTIFGEDKNYVLNDAQDGDVSTDLNQTSARSVAPSQTVRQRG